MSKKVLDGDCTRGLKYNLIKDLKITVANDSC